MEEFEIFSTFLVQLRQKEEMNKLKIEDNGDHTTISREDNHFFPACYLNGGPPVLHSGQRIRRGYSRMFEARQLAEDIMEVSRSIAYIIVRQEEGLWHLTLWEYPIDSIVWKGTD